MKSICVGIVVCLHRVKEEFQTVCGKRSGGARRRLSKRGEYLLLDIDQKYFTIVRSFGTPKA